jgi:hypothetical protein
MGGWENEGPVANLGAAYARPERATEALLTLVLT